MASVQCKSCDLLMDSSMADRAVAIVSRHSLGDLYSDLECPECGSLCYPVDPMDQFPRWRLSPQQVLDELERMSRVPGADPAVVSLYRHIVGIEEGVGR